MKSKKQQKKANKLPKGLVKTIQETEKATARFINKFNDMIHAITVHLKNA